MSKSKVELELLPKPGDTISETLDYIKMSQAELAERMGKTPSKVNDLISGKEPITMTTALQLEKVLGIDAQFWLNREMNYRVKLTRLEQEKELEEWIDWLKIQPLKELKKYGYLKTERVSTAMAEECLKFYGVATPNQWESLYINQYVAARFRKSNSHMTTLGGMAAWLRIGEIEMRKLNLKEYNRDLFKECLMEIKGLVRAHPEDFATRLKEICLQAGVALVYTMCISKAPISGVARWVGGNPLIQLTDRYKSNDHFWFTFFHEAGHILLHSKKEVFIDVFEDIIASNEKEAEANEFANKNLLPEDITANLPVSISEKDIRQLARKFNTHPAIILGRLQHLKILPYYFGSSLRLKVVLDELIRKTE